MRRTPQQRDFDWGIKGWAFRDKAALRRLIPIAEKLLEAIPPADRGAREKTLAAIKEAARRNLD